MSEAVNTDAPTKPRAFSEGEVRMASRRISALVRMNPEARFCPPCLAIDLHAPLVTIIAAVHRLLGPNGMRLSSHAPCARCGAHTAVVYFTDACRFG